jgi:hypothetical protein
VSSQTPRPFLSRSYRKKLILELSGQLYDVPLNTGQGLREASAIELNFLKRHNTLKQLFADRIVM